MVVENNSSINLTLDGDRGVFYTVQGEGTYNGRPAVFVRLSGCNLRCEWRNSDGSTTRCDTPYSSFEPEENRRATRDVVVQVSNHSCQHVVITGGEPFVQEAVTNLIDSLVDLGSYVTVETNGTIFRKTRAQFISISPKLSSSCNPREWNAKRLAPKAIKSFIKHHDYQIKFVIHVPEDLQEIFAFRDSFDIPNEKIYLMPQGIEHEDLKKRGRWVVELCKQNRFNFCPRTHIELWGNRRGV